MFTSCGNFRGLNCPFYALGNGVCRRPYCHFRHVRSSSRSETDRSQLSRPPGTIDDVYPQTADVSNFVVATPTPAAPSSSAPPPSPAPPSTTSKKNAAPKKTAIQYVPTPIAQIALARRRHKMAASRTSKKAKTSTPSYVPTPLSQITVQPEGNSSSQKYQLTDSLTNEADDSEYDPTKTSYAFSSDSKSDKYSLDLGIPAGEDEYDPFGNGSLLAPGKRKAARSEPSVQGGYLDVASVKSSNKGKRRGQGKRALESSTGQDDDGLYDFDDPEKTAGDKNADEIIEYDPFHNDDSSSSHNTAKYTPTAKYSISAFHLEQGDETEYDPCSNFSSGEIFEKEPNLEKGSKPSYYEESSDSDVLVIDEQAENKRKASSSDEEPVVKKQKCTDDDQNTALENEGSMDVEKAGNDWLGNVAQENFLVGTCGNFDPPSDSSSSYYPTYSYNPGETQQGKDGFNSSEKNLNPVEYLTKLSKSSTEDGCAKEKHTAKSSKAVPEKKRAPERKVVPQESKKGSSKTKSVCETKQKSLTKKTADATKRKEFTKEKQIGVSKNEEKKPENDNKQTNGVKEKTNADGEIGNEVEISEKSKPTVSSDQLSSFFKKMDERKSQKAKVNAIKERSKQTNTNKQIVKAASSVETTPKIFPGNEKTSQKLAKKQDTQNLTSGDRKPNANQSRNLPEKGKIIVIGSSSSSEDNLAKPLKNAITNGAPEENSLENKTNPAAKISKRKTSTKLLFGEDSDSDGLDVQIIKIRSEAEIVLISDGSLGTDRKVKAHESKHRSTPKEGSLTLSAKQNRNNSVVKTSSGRSSLTKADDRKTSRKPTKTASSQKQPGQKMSPKDHVREDSSLNKTSSKESKTPSSQKQHGPKSSPEVKLRRNSSHPGMKGKSSTDIVARIKDSSTTNRTKPTVEKKILRSPPKVSRFATSDEESCDWPPYLGLEGISTSDYEDAGLNDEYDVNNVDWSFSESDTFEECLKIFQEENVEVPIKKPRKPHPEPEQPKNEDLVLSTGKQRVAHTSKIMSSAQARHRKCAPKPKTRLTPLQVCHNRYVQAQQHLLEQRKQDRQTDEDKQRTRENPAGYTTPAAGNVSKRIAHIPSSRPSANAGTVKSSASSVMGVNAMIQQKYSIGHSEEDAGKTIAITAPKGERRQAHVPKKSEKMPKVKSEGKTTTKRTTSKTKTKTKRKTRTKSKTKRKTTRKKRTSKAKTSTAASGRKRKATSELSGSASSKKPHVVLVFAETVNPRPVIPPDLASKVPSNVRQRYLNLFIDEFLKTTQSEQEAFDQGLKEEKVVYDRATSKNIYLNLSINTLKRLRAAQAPSQSKLTSSPPGKASISHEAVIGGKAATQHTYTLNRSLQSRLASQEDKYEGAFLYTKLKSYLLTEGQLYENKYPRPSDNPGYATVKEDDAKKRTSADPNQHICSRCGKTFLRRPDGYYITRESCTYHWGKFWHNKVGGSIEGRFTCCSGTSDAKGCCISKYHVTEEKTSNLTGFMKTVAKSPSSDGNPGLYAVDCEMCYTVKALELTRVTVIDDKLQCVYDTLVKPSVDIVDYNTRFSGITEEDMKSATTTLQDVQAVLLSMVSSDTILIGHSLESDLLSLKMIHSTVIDTAVLFPHRRGLPFKRALRTLMAECLNRIIQNDVGGHDSKEDAKSCMELMIWKAKQDSKIKKSLL